MLEEFPEETYVVPLPKVEPSLEGFVSEEERYAPQRLHEPLDEIKYDAPASVRPALRPSRPSVLDVRLITAAALGIMLGVLAAWPTVRMRGTPAGISSASSAIADSEVAESAIDAAPTSGPAREPRTEPRPKPSGSFRLAPALPPTIQPQPLLRVAPSAPAAPLAPEPRTATLDDLSTPTPAALRDEEERAPSNAVLEARPSSVPRPSPSVAAAPVTSPVTSPVTAPAALAPPPTTRSADEQQAIQQVLARYRTAYSSRDVTAVKQVWPSARESALTRAFGDLESQNLAFNSCDTAVTGATARATCEGEVSYVGRVGSRQPKRQNREWTFVLRKSDADAWQIERVQVR